MLADVSATQLKPDEGTPDLPQGRVRLRLHTDGSLLDVAEDQIDKVSRIMQMYYSFMKVLPTATPEPHQCNPAHLDLCDDLSELQSINESSVLHTLITRAKANMPLTHAGPNLINFWPPLQTHSKVTPLCVSIVALMYCIEM